MNLHSVERKLLFERAHRSCRHRVRDDRKKGRLRNETHYLTVILGIIGRDSHGPVRGQRAIEQGWKFFAHQAPLRMAAFRPRIGKHKVKRRDGILREQPLEGVRDLELNDACILQSAPRDLPTGAAHSANQTLNAEEISVGVFAGKGREKRTITAAEINFDGRMSPIDLFEIERCETINRDEFHLACYACGTIAGQHLR